jgi:tRNA threonylcarbamoyladenosine biosynthesis protein TsaE
MLSRFSLYGNRKKTDSSHILQKMLSLAGVGTYMVILTSSEAETMREGEKLGKTLVRGAVVALCGDLGAGKTAFTRGLASGLGINAHVSSPTFTIVNEYPGDIPMFHFDLFRLENEFDLCDIGWDDYLDRGGICAVEWADKIPCAFPPDTTVVRFENLGGDMRRLEIN